MNNENNLNKDFITIKIPYDKSTLDLNIEKERINAILTSKVEEYKPDLSEEELVLKALENPISSLPLCEIAKDKKHIVIISSDHTRPVPSHITMPIILREIRKYNKDVKVTILIATGMHRPSTHEELVNKYGEKIVKEEEIIIHDAYKDEDMVFKGILPSGGELWVNKLVNECDLLMSEGFIEPHFFAGFSGGRKSVLPGIASKKTVLWNHNASFIASPFARTGSIDENPIHKDMIFAASTCQLQFIINVVLNGEKKIINAFAGDLHKAHKEGYTFLNSLAQVDKQLSDIVITSNGGYPLDQNIYQTVKGLSCGEMTVNQGGVIIICSSCKDGTGGDFFYHLLKDYNSAKEAYQAIIDVEAKNTQFDQWEAQVLARVLTKANVIVVTTNQDPKLFEEMHMMHAYSLEEALEKAEKIVGRNKKITVIPDGISVIIN